EDGIRDFHVTGVQTCALPISDAFAVVFLVGALLHAFFAQFGWVERYEAYLLAIGYLPVFMFLMRERTMLCNKLRNQRLVVTLLRSEERRVGKECISRRPACRA